MTASLKDHPCFDESARLRTARVHLPVAPRCNIACNYCDRKSDCVSESRPGVSSTVLSPDQAADYVDRVREEVPNLTVVGIAGPGDPFANPEATLESLRLVKDRHPDLMLCLASNGLAMPEYLDDVASIGVSHVTITINTVDPEVGARIYRWVRDKRIVYRGVDGATLLLERQLDAVRGLKERGVVVKINTILVPGVNLDGIEDVARTMAELGADTMNCLPLYPVEGTPFGELETPEPAAVSVARSTAGRHVAQMAHCTRCRADAVGLIGDENDDDDFARLLMSRTVTKDRPYVAVASQEGYLVNQHLGGADRLLIFAETEHGPKLHEVRPAPAPGGGARRWAMLAATLSDCRALLVHQLGGSPRMVLERAGLSAYETEGLITEAVADVFAGREPRKLLPKRDCATSCSGGGGGCA